MGLIIYRSFKKMGLQGQFKKFGYSVPANAPLYTAPPYLFQGSKMLLFTYVTDGPSAAQIVPPDLELTDPPMAGLLMAEHPWTGFGPYKEVGQFVICRFRDETVFYITHMYLDSDAAMGMGREMAGYPKKMAKIDFKFETFYLATLQRPNGLPLCSGVFRPEKPATDPIPWPMKFATLHLIPSAQKDAPPVLHEVLLTDFTVKSGQVWDGSGNCHYTGASVLDPLHVVPVVAPISAKLIMGDLEYSAPVKLVADVV
jgi:acetoacetate decarboxylase